MTETERQIIDQVQQLNTKFDRLLEFVQNGFLLSHPVQTSGLPDAPLPLRDWLSQWYELYKKPRLKPSTLRMYQSYIADYLCPALGDIPIEQLDANQIQSYLNTIPYANTRVKVGNLLGSALEKAVKTQKLHYNPYAAIELTIPKAKHYLPLDFHAQSKLLSGEHNELYLHCFWVLCCTGLRAGEFIALDFSKDIDFKNSEILITKATDTTTGITGTPKTETSRRTIPFIKQLIPHLRYLCNHQKKNGNITYYMLRQHFKRLYTRLNLPGYNLHTFRHTFVSLCYYAGMRDKQIQQLAGHADINMTLNVYTHVLRAGDSPILHYIKALKKHLEKATM